MHNLNLNLDIFHFLTYLNDYGVYIFLCGIFGFGSLIYFFSIKSPNPQFSTSKLSRKKVKKEKNVRNKDLKVDFLKPDNKEPVDISKKQDVDLPDVGKDATDDDINSAWHSVVKPKRVTKRTKVSEESLTVTKVITQEKTTVKPIVTCDNSGNVIKNDQKKSVINTASSKPQESLSSTKPKETVSIAIDKKSTIEADRKSQSTMEQPKKKDQKPVQDQTRATVKTTKTTGTEVNISESPTNSLSDDFELIDMIKTSSEEGSKTEINERSIETSGLLSQISSTSGASRKKIKKQQKMVSKQLIEAAEIDLDPLSSTKDRGSTPATTLGENKSSPIKIDLKSAITLKKKKRPRKDI